eukprot:14283813-Alexandrium_andersonii.AAC.1
MPRPVSSSLLMWLAGMLPRLATLAMLSLLLGPPGLPAKLRFARSATASCPLLLSSMPFD